MPLRTNTETALWVRLISVADDGSLWAEEDGLLSRAIPRNIRLIGRVSGRVRVQRRVGFRGRTDAFGWNAGDC